METTALKVYGNLAHEKSQWGAFDIQHLQKDTLKNYFVEQISYLILIRAGKEEMAERSMLNVRTERTEGQGFES